MKETIDKFTPIRSNLVWIIVVAIFRLLWMNKNRMEYYTPTPPFICFFFTCWRQTSPHAFQRIQWSYQRFLMISPATLLASHRFDTINKAILLRLRRVWIIMVSWYKLSLLIRRLIWKIKETIKKKPNDI